MGDGTASSARLDLVCICKRLAQYRRRVSITNKSGDDAQIADRCVHKSASRGSCCELWGGFSLFFGFSVDTRLLDQSAVCTTAKNSLLPKEVGDEWKTSHERVKVKQRPPPPGASFDHHLGSFPHRPSSILYLRSEPPDSPRQSRKL